MHFQPGCEQERCRPLRLPPPVPLRTRPAVLLKGDRAAAWKLHRHADRQGGSEPWGGGRWARPRAENRMAVGSLVDTRPALRKTRPQRCGRGGQTTQEAVRKAAISRQRPRRRQPRKTDWSPHGPSRQQRPVAGAGWGRGSVLASPPVSLCRPSLSPSPAERGAQTATPPAARRPPPHAPGSRVQSPDSRHPGLSAPSLQLPGSLWFQKFLKNHQLSLQSVTLRALYPCVCRRGYTSSRRRHLGDVPGRMTSADVTQAWRS